MDVLQVPEDKVVPDDSQQTGGAEGTTSSSSSWRSRRPSRSPSTRPSSTGSTPSALGLRARGLEDLMTGVPGATSSSRASASWRPAVRAGWLPRACPVPPPRGRRGSTSSTRRLVRDPKEARQTDRFTFASHLPPARPRRRGRLRRRPLRRGLRDGDRRTRHDPGADGRVDRQGPAPGLAAAGPMMMGNAAAAVSIRFAGGACDVATACASATHAMRHHLPPRRRRPLCHHRRWPRRRSPRPAA